MALVRTTNLSTCLEEEEMWKEEEQSWKEEEQSLKVEEQSERKNHQIDTKLTFKGWVVQDATSNRE